MENGYIVEKDRMIKNLHQCIQEIYYQGAIPFMQSCLIETITNAFGRFSQLEACNFKTIEVTDGPNMNYISCPLERKASIDKYFSILEQLSSIESNLESLNVLAVEVTQAVKISARHYQPQAKL